MPFHVEASKPPGGLSMSSMALRFGRAAKVSLSAASRCNSGYDGLDRPTVKSYSDGKTPQVAYVYDAASVAYSLGRLTESAIVLPPQTTAGMIRWAV